MCPPGRVEWMACIIDSWVPTASITECAPRPSVSSLILATPSSPRSVTTSVAPKSRASFWRDSWRLMAMTRSAPSCRAARTASRPTAPSPTTATVLPGCTSAATAPNQPVPSTSEAASRLGTRSSDGTSGVATKVPSASGIRPARPGFRARPWTRGGGTSSNVARPSGSCGALLLSCWPQQDLVDGQAARTAEDEGDDLGDVFGGDLGLVVELLDPLSGVGVGDVVRQLGGHDTWLDERHAHVGQQFLPQ